MMIKDEMRNGKFKLRLLSLLLVAVILFDMQEVNAYATTIRQVSENHAEDIEDTGNGTTTDESIGNNNNGLSSNDLLVINNTVAAAGTPANPVHHCTGLDDGSDYTDWSYVYFGSYPQSEVTDAATKLAIDSAIASEGKTSSGEGIDVWVGSTKYRRISRSDCNYDVSFDKVTNNGYRYFKWERIKWRVLQNKDSELCLISDKVLDCKSTENDFEFFSYETSDIRRWISLTFYKVAFSEVEREAIINKKIKNDNINSVGNNTVDAVYLPSYADVINENYGFCNKHWGTSVSRKFIESDYADAMGSWAMMLRSRNAIDEGFLYISTGEYEGMGHINGVEVDSFDILIMNENGGIAPILNIEQSSNLWFLTDDGTSGLGGGENIKPDNTTDSKQKPTAVKVSSLAITGISKKIAAGKSVQLTAEVSPADASDKTVTWTSSNTKFATVNASGKVSVKKAGAGKSVTITAKVNDGSGVTATYKITIMKDAVKSIKLLAANKTVKAGKSVKVKATVKTTGKKVNKALKWTSSNTDYATVNKSGKVTIKKAGKGKTVTITAQATDGSGKKANIKIKIK